MDGEPPWRADTRGFNAYKFGLCGLAESIPGLIKRLQIRALEWKTFLGPNAQMALALLGAISGPKKVSISRVHPFQCPCNGYYPPQNHYILHHIHENNRYIDSYYTFIGHKRPVNHSLDSIYLELNKTCHWCNLHTRNNETIIPLNSITVYNRKHNLQ